METIDYVQAPNLLNKIKYSDWKCIAVIDSCVVYLEIYMNECILIFCILMQIPLVEVLSFEWRFLY